MAETSSNHNLHLTRGSLLARNVVWNLLGNGAPMVVAVFCIPVLIHGLGKDRFGVLALAWALIGYASLFDLGLGRALTQLVARKLGAGEEREVPSIVWTSLLLMLLLGLAGTGVILLASPWLVQRVLSIPRGLQAETLRAFYLLALSIPVVISTAGLRGLLEVHQRFDLINALRIPMGVFTFAGPLLVLPFSKSLFPVVAVLLGGRLIAWAAHLLLCLRVAPALRQRLLWHGPAVGPLLRFGGWMTVTNVVGPLMVSLDRFVIGALLSVTAVAYYATPFEVVTKLWLIPAALVAVMFPAFSTSFVLDQRRTKQLLDQGLTSVFLCLFPVVLLIITFAQDGLKLWLGMDFARNSTRALQLLALGVFINCAAQIPFALIQGSGRPDLTAKLHLAELPAYVLGLCWAIQTRGIEGAAFIWMARATIDALALFVLAAYVLPIGKVTVRRHMMLLGGAMAALGCGLFPARLTEKIVFLVFAFSALAVICRFALPAVKGRVSLRHEPGIDATE